MADYPISNVPRRVQYVNSGVGPYAFTFEILVQTDIAVYRGNTLLTLTTDYTVVINANGTGSITLVTAGTGNITIVGARAIQRSSDYTTGGDLFASTLNTDLDSQTIYSQQLAETLDRTIKVPVTDASTLNMQLPSSTVRANKVFAFDSNGAPQASTNTLAAIDAAVDTVESIASAPSGNSAGISHIASGSGAVATTVQAKLRETVSVKDFGAVGDGTTNDRAAIQAALDYCATLTNGCTLFFPAGSGKYKCNSGITIDTGTTSVDFGGCVLDFSAMTSGYAISVITSISDPNRQNTYNFAHPIQNGILISSSADIPVTAMYFNDASTFGSGGNVKNMGFINFNQDVYFGNGAFCIEFNHCNFTVDNGGAGYTAYSIVAPGGVSNAGERQSFIGCMWNNRDYVFEQANAGANAFFVNCSFDGSPSRVMTVTAGAVYIASSHIEQTTDLDYYFSCTGTNSLISVTDTDLIFQSNKSTYAAFYSDSTCTTGGIVLDNIRIGGGGNIGQLIDGTGKTVVRNIMAPVIFGLPPVSSYQNALAYSGFESANYTAEWTLTAGAVRSTAQAYQGTHSLSFPGTVSLNPNAAATAPCVAGQSFSGSLYYILPAITGTGGTFFVQYDYLDKGGNSLASGTPLLATANVGTWTKINIRPQIITPTGTVSVKISVGLFGVTSGTPVGYVDNVILNAV